MDELSLVLIVVAVPVVASIFLYVYTSNTSMMSICYEYGTDQHDEFEVSFEGVSPIIGTI